MRSSEVARVPCELRSVATSLQGKIYEETKQLIPLCECVRIFIAVSLIDEKRLGKVLEGLKEKNGRGKRFIYFD